MQGKRTKNIKGQKFSRLLALKFVGVNKFRFALWLFKCDCGKKVKRPANNVRSGLIKSCGCLNDEVRRKKHFTEEQQKQKRSEYWRKYYKQHKEYLIRRVIEYQKKNRDYRIEATRSKERRRNDINYRIKMNIRNRLIQAVKKNQKGGSFIKNLGCSIEEFKSYIESKFKKGMTWENYGKWQIDHIKPLSVFDLTDKEQFKQAIYFTNHQPLWKEENQKKGNKFGLIA